MSMGVGDRFAGFRVIRQLGAGGMGEVYLVAHPRLPRQEALKVLPPQLSGDPQYRVRFNREADTAATLFHPNIVGVHDRGEFDGKLWLSMDYVDGVDLSALIRDRYPRGLPVADVVAVITQIASALDHAHGRGLIHRDVKPANILLADTRVTGGRVLLADFGIARRMDDDAGLTATNTAVGTVSYAAPEQLADDPVDGRADQYALAATALTLLTGRAPFAGTTPGAVITRKLRGETPRAAATDPSLAPLDRALSVAMAVDPARRFPTCGRFAEALAAEARRPPAPPPGFAPQTVHTPSQPFPPAHAAPQPATRPWQVTAAAVLLFVAAAFAGILAIPGFADPSIGAGLGALWAVGALGGVVGGVLVLTRRAGATPIIGTVGAVLVGSTCLGLIATVAVTILLWAARPARAWFAGD